MAASSASVKNKKALLLDAAKMLPDPSKMPKQSDSSKFITKPKPMKPINLSADTLVGFNAAFLQFANDAGINLKTNIKEIEYSQPIQSLSVANISGDNLKFDSTSSRKIEAKSLVELRSYTEHMDSFANHSLNIYGGKVVKNSPEFVIYQKEFASQFGGISVLLRRLETFLSNHGVKHAVVNGTALYEIALLNPPYVSQDDLNKCIVNMDQIQPQLNKKNMYGSNIRYRAALKIQTFVRKRQAVNSYYIRRKELYAAITLQAKFRTTIQRVRTVNRSKFHRGQLDKRFKMNQLTLYNSWAIIPSEKKRLLIHIPSIAGDENVRIAMSNINYVHASYISCLWQLAHPNIHIVFICPIYFGNDIIDYYERFLAMIGIPIFPRRFHFIVPEATGVDTYPQHLPQAHHLWYSTMALQKVKYLMKHFEEACVIPTMLSTVEKRICYFLNCPLLGPNPSNGDLLSSRSFVKRIFMSCCVNLPVGAHDIGTPEDLFVALTRLITSNLDVPRWGIRLNNDFNNDSYIYFEPDTLPLHRHLIKERAMLVRTNNYNASVWFSNPVQLSARKRLMPLLITQFSSLVKICQPHIYKSWQDYCERILQTGAIIEAEPKSLSLIDGLCFITPSGFVESIVGVNVHVNDSMQSISYGYPQTHVPTEDISSVMSVIGNKLFAEFQIIGYVTVSFMAYCDSKDGLVRLWGHSIRVGLSPTFGAVGVTGILNKEDDEIEFPASLYPAISNEKCFMYIPVAVHPPLKGTRDDVFFRLAKMHRVVFDTDSRTGILFFLLDSVVSGYLSILCIAPSRKKVLEYAVNALTFVSQQFGKDFSPPEERRWDNLTDILYKLKLEIRKDKRGK